MIAAAYHELPTTEDVKLQADHIPIPYCGGICSVSNIPLNVQTGFSIHTLYEKCLNYILYYFCGISYVPFRWITLLNWNCVKRAKCT